MTTPMPHVPGGSLFSRLSGEEEGRGSSSRRGGRYDIVESIREGLENLLNTRWRCRSWPPDLDELDQSLVNYGIPDFSGISYGNTAGHRELRRVLEQCIRRFEPRLRYVRVLPPERDDRKDRTLRFRVEAEVEAGPDSRSVAFETALDAATTYFQVGFAPR